MNANLDELSKNMKSLIHTINQFQKQISTPYESKKSNYRTSILIKIPKYILLTKILPYLTYRQCHYLSNVSVFIRRSIYSPLGWKVMTQIHSPYDTIIINPEIIKRPKKAISYSSGAEDNLEDYEDQKFLLKERAKYKDILWAKYKQHTSLQQKNEVLEEKVRTQKLFLFKIKLEKSFFQKERDELQQENIKFKEKLKKLSGDFVSRDQKLAKKIEEIQSENQKLQKQKEALISKIKQYQEEIPKIQQKAETSKRTLKMLKDFVQNRNFQPLEDINN